MIMVPCSFDQNQRYEVSLRSMTIEEAWNGEPAKATAFFDWLKKVKKDFASVPYRQKPPFRLPKHQILGIKATATSNCRSYPYKNNGEPIPKNCGIDFKLLYRPNCLVVDTP